VRPLSSCGGGVVRWGWMSTVRPSTTENLAVSESMKDPSPPDSRVASASAIDALLHPLTPPRRAVRARTGIEEAGGGFVGPLTDGRSDPTLWYPLRPHHPCRGGLRPQAETRSLEPDPARTGTERLEGEAAEERPPAEEGPRPVRTHPRLRRPRSLPRARRSCLRPRPPAPPTT
jgi:hypothetical protein